MRPALLTFQSDSDETEDDEIDTRAPPSDPVFTTRHSRDPIPNLDLPKLQSMALSDDFRLPDPPVHPADMFEMNIRR